MQGIISQRFICFVVSAHFKIIFHICNIVAVLLRANIICFPDVYICFKLYLVGSVFSFMLTHHLFNSNLKSKIKSTLSLSRRRPLSYRNQFIDLLCKSMECFYLKGSFVLKVTKKTITDAMLVNLWWILSKYIPNVEFSSVGKIIQAV